MRVGSTGLERGIRWRIEYNPVGVRTIAGIRESRPPGWAQGAEFAATVRPNGLELWARRADLQRTAAVPRDRDRFLGVDAWNLI